VGAVKCSAATPWGMIWLADWKTADEAAMSPLRTDGQHRVAHGDRAAFVGICPLPGDPQHKARLAWTGMNFGRAGWGRSVCVQVVPAFGGDLDTLSLPEL